MPAHGGGAACVRWGNSGGDTRGALLVSGGADRWARVWRVRAAGARIVSAAAVPAGNAGGAPAVAVMGKKSQNIIMNFILSKGLPTGVY